MNDPAHAVTPPEGVATKITARTKPPTTKPSN